MRDEFVWHNKILTSRLRFISLFDDIDEMTKRRRIIRARKASANRSTPAPRKEMVTLTQKKYMVVTNYHI